MPRELTITIHQARSKLHKLLDREIASLRAKSREQLMLAGATGITMTQMRTRKAISSRRAQEAREMELVRDEMHAVFELGQQRLVALSDRGLANVDAWSLAATKKRPSARARRPH